MKVKVVSPFRDLQENLDRKRGDEFECTEERFNAINATEYGILVEPAEQPLPKVTRRRAKKSE